VATASPEAPVRGPEPKHPRPVGRICGIAALVLTAAAASPVGARCGGGSGHHSEQRQETPAPADSACCTDSAAAPAPWGEHHARSASPSPYAGLESRPVKALSEQRRAGLLAGAGLGYAMAAELNGHAGPKHVLELAPELELTAEQRAGVQASFDHMHAESVRLGEAILAAEEHLDRRFAHRHLDAATLAALTAEIARLEGQLRFAHLKAHLETDALLTPAQQVRYVELRGYDQPGHVPNPEHVHVP
jgi:Spy/CpxP family protein refolding chaperone